MAVQMQDIISFDVTEEVIQQAIAIRAERDAKYGNYFPVSDSDMRHCGEVGEIILNSALQKAAGPYYTWHNSGKVNNEPDFTLFGRKFDLKTVKRTVPIQTRYEAQVTKKQIHIPVDDYVFACFELQASKLHIVGAMSKVQFVQQSKYYGPGDKVHAHYTIRDGHEIYNIEINKLFPFREYLTFNKERFRLKMSA